MDVSAPARILDVSSPWRLLSQPNQRRHELDWNTLPADAIEAISSRITDDADYVYFRSVCTWWRATPPKRPQIPWILVIYDDDAEIHDLGMGLCNFPNTKLSNRPRLPAGITQGKVICGSSRGWIALLDSAPGITLHNPFTGAHVHLPLLTNLPWINKSDQDFVLNSCVFHFRGITRFLAKKVMLSSNPEGTNFVVLALSNNYGRLICCRSGDTSWTVLPSFGDEAVDKKVEIDDIIFYNGKFFIALGFRLFVCFITPNNANVTEVLPRDPLFSDGSTRKSYDCLKTSYLVVSAGDLLLVAVVYPHFDCGDPNCDDCDSFSFEVFRVDLTLNETHVEQLSLFKLDNLGGRSLFIGCRSMSVSAGNSPLCKGNCIYYISGMDPDDWKDKIVVFSMQDGKVDLVTVFSDDRITNWKFHWLTPSLCY